MTRHQLFIHEDIPYTSHNSCAVVHIASGDRGYAGEIFKRVEELVLGNFIKGSDPGIAVATEDQLEPALIAFGKDAKTMVLTQERARTLARNLSIRLKGLGGTEDGVIGAMAGLGLAATNNDGRFVQTGKIREILGPCSVRTLRNAGIEAISTLDGQLIDSGYILVEEDKSVKPCPVNGRVILYVEERDGRYHAVKRD